MLSLAARPSRSLCSDKSCKNPQFFAFLAFLALEHFAGSPGSELNGLTQAFAREFVRCRLKKCQAGFSGPAWQ